MRYIAVWLTLSLLPLSCLASNYEPFGSQRVSFEALPKAQPKPTPTRLPAKKCECSERCTCGCQEGYACVCATASRPAPTYQAPRYSYQPVPAPVYYRPVVAPTLYAPRMIMAPRSFGGGGMACSGGG